eukprot:scaffold3.g6538.t1
MRADAWSEEEDAGVLAEYLEELLEMEAAGEGALSLLPPQAKGPLLAAARARCLLTDAALLALADHYGEVLCLRGCGGLSGAAIQQALLRMPHLQQVDVRGCDVGARQLRTLGQACSRVSLLRLGGPATDRAPGVAAALRGVLPGLGGRDAPPADSWEALAGDAPSDGRGGDVGPAGRLMGLQCIVWDGMPYALAQRLAVSCPAVVLNPSALDAAQHGWPPEFAPDWELDAALLQGVAHSERWCAQQGGGRTEEEQPVVHIAERFRLAYISRARREGAVQEGPAVPPHHSSSEIDMCRKVVPLIEFAEDVCSICLDEYTRADPGVPTDCGHSYHLQCVMQWAQRSRECPLCFKALHLKDEALNELLPFGEYVSPEAQAMGLVDVESWELERLLIRLAATNSRQELRALRHQHRHAAAAAAAAAGPRGRRSAPQPIAGAGGGGRHHGRRTDPGGGAGGGASDGDGEGRRRASTPGAYPASWPPAGEGASSSAHQGGDERSGSFKSKFASLRLRTSESLSRTTRELKSLFSPSGSGSGSGQRHDRSGGGSSSSAVQ